jgi:hypothetical protein
MKLSFAFLLLSMPAMALPMMAQDGEKKPSSSTPARLDQKDKQPSPGKISPEMQKFFNAFVGSWSLRETIEPSESAPNGGTGSGEVVFRPGPGGNSIIEEIRLVEPTGKSIGLGLGWWDEKARGYRTVWCENGNPGGCIVMAHLAKWESDQFVAGDEFERNGKKFVFKEVLSDITPTSYTQTLYQGEAGKELKKLATIHATRSNH